jgi:hypothetical protein
MTKKKHSKMNKAQDVWKEFVKKNNIKKKFLANLN